jgi:purine-nucleoside phosphorylase
MPMPVTVAASIIILIIRIVAIIRIGVVIAISVPITVAVIVIGASTYPDGKQASKYEEHTAFHAVYLQFSMNNDFG